MNGSLKSALVLTLLLGGSTIAHAQDHTSPPSLLPEDLQPRVIGDRGTTLIGMAGYIDRLLSPEDAFPTHYTAQIDVGRFVTRRLVARGGLAGSGSFGGDAADGPAAGSGVPALHAFAGGLFYLTPQSMVSLYSGIEYWAQLTQRPEADAGSLVAKLGVQGAVSSRVSLFVEGGYGLGLTRGDRGELRSRIVGQIGVRLKR